MKKRWWMVRVGGDVKYQPEVRHNNTTFIHSRLSLVRLLY